MAAAAICKEDMKDEETEESSPCGGPAMLTAFVNLCLIWFAGIFANVVAKSVNYVVSPPPPPFNDTAAVDFRVSGSALAHVALTTRNNSWEAKLLFTVIMAVVFLIVFLWFQFRKKAMNKIHSELRHKRSDKDLDVTYNTTVDSVTNQLASGVASKWFKVFPASDWYVIPVVLLAALLLTGLDTLKKSFASKESKRAAAVNFVTIAVTGFSKWYVALILVSLWVKDFGQFFDGLHAYAIWVLIFSAGFFHMKFVGVLQAKCCKDPTSKVYGASFFKMWKGGVMKCSAVVLYNIVKVKWAPHYLQGAALWTAITLPLVFFMTQITAYVAWKFDFSDDLRGHLAESSSELSQTFSWVAGHMIAYTLIMAVAEYDWDSGSSAVDRVPYILCTVACLAAALGLASVRLTGAFTTCAPCNEYEYEEVSESEEESEEEEE